MGLLGRIRHKSLSEEGPFSSDPGGWVDMSAPIAPSSSFLGYESQLRRGYCENPYVSRCVDLISDTVSSLEPIVYDIEGNEVQEPRLQRLLSRPNPIDAWQGYVYESVSDLVLSGNSFSIPVQTVRGVEEVWAVPTGNVTAEETSDFTDPVRAWIVSNGRGAIRVEPSRMIHAHRKLDNSGVWGISPLRPAGRSIVQQTEAREWNLSLMRNGAKPSLVVMQPGAMPAWQFEEFMSRMRARHAGTNNAGGVMVLDGGKTLATAGFNARDMDYSTGVTTSGREIAIALGVPPELVGDSANKTYANAAEANREFALHTVVPYANRFYGALSRRICPAYEGISRIGYDSSQIDGMRGDEAQMMAALESCSFLTVNEKRARLGFEPVPDGDVILTAMGDVPLSEVSTPIPDLVGRDVPSV